MQFPSLLANPVFLVNIRHTYELKSWPWVCITGIPMFRAGS